MNVQTDASREADAIRQCRAGNADAFGPLVRSYQTRIFATVYRILGDAEDARDLCQEAFLKAWSRLETFREGARFSTWLYTIALNLTKSELRRRKVRKGLKAVPLSFGGTDETGSFPDPPDPGDPPETVAGRRELYARALSALETLDEASREVVVLRDMQELSYEEIAEVVGVPIGTVRSRLHRARRALRLELAPAITDRRRPGGAS